MFFEFNDKRFPIEIIKKDNKNTYIRVRDNTIFITTNRKISDKEIIKLLEENMSTIIKMLKLEEKRSEKKGKFLLFGEEYEIIYGDFEKKLIIEEGKIKVLNQDVLLDWLDRFIECNFQGHLLKCAYWFGETVPMPNLVIKKMKSRWGVCNRKTETITLNLELFRYDYDCLDYVIVHELAHFLVPNHSREFWKVVEKYCPNYKEIRKKLREK